MYHLINKNIKKVLSGINREKEINPYLTILKVFSEGHVTNNDRFKSDYKKYYQLNAAKLSEEFCNHYFSVKQGFRHKDCIHIRDVVEELYKVPTNAKGVKVIMFSFASKLFHTVDNSQPLYDSFVADFYFFPQITPYWKYDKKLATYLESYNYLQREYKRIMDNHILSESIGLFRKRFELPQAYTDYKIIDTLLWRFAAYLRSGAITSNEIKYS